MLPDVPTPQEMARFVKSETIKCRKIMEESDTRLDAR